MHNKLALSRAVHADIIRIHPVFKVYNGQKKMFEHLGTGVLIDLTEALLC